MQQVPVDIYKQGCIQDLESGLAAARSIGFPVMIKVLDLIMTYSFEEIHRTLFNLQYFAPVIHSNDLNCLYVFGNIVYDKIISSIENFGKVMS